MNDISYIVLGILQGVTEWLPVSSKTVEMLVSAYVFGYTLSTSYSIGLALQGGTVASATTYFWRSLSNIFYDKKLLLFIIISTLFTGLIGVPLYVLSKKLLGESLNPGMPTLVIGLLLLAQALLYKKIRGEGSKGFNDIRLRDMMIFGLAQGLAALPGVSRSGITITTLLYLGYSLEESMKISFIASVFANSGALVAVYMLSREVLTSEPLNNIMIMFIVSALVGLATIKTLLSLARRCRTETMFGISILTLTLGLLMILTS